MWKTSSGGAPEATSVASRRSAACSSTVESFDWVSIRPPPAAGTSPSRPRPAYRASSERLAQGSQTRLCAGYPQSVGECADAAKVAPGDACGGRSINKRVTVSPRRRCVGVRERRTLLGFEGIPRTHLGPRRYERSHKDDAACLC